MTCNGVLVKYKNHFKLSGTPCLERCFLNRVASRAQAFDTFSPMVFWILCYKVRAVVQELNNNFVVQKYSLVPVSHSSVCIQYYTEAERKPKNSKRGRPGNEASKNIPVICVPLCKSCTQAQEQFQLEGTPSPK